jgi:DNA-binding transcriptional regulator WhiA
MLIHLFSNFSLCIMVWRIAIEIRVVRDSYVRKLNKYLCKTSGESNSTMYTVTLLTSFFFLHISIHKNWRTDKSNDFKNACSLSLTSRKVMNNVECEGRKILVYPLT